MATDTPTALGEDLLFLLSQASHALQTELTAKLAEIGVTPRSHCVLRQAREGGLTQTQLADMCALDKTTMVVTMDELEKAGLASRRPSPTDRRARIVTVTPAGERIVDEGHAIVARIYDDVLATLAPDVHTGLMEGLRQLVRGRLSTPMACERPVRRRVPRAPS